MSDPVSKCPKCGAALKDDYGMVPCSSCGTILFIDMEGVAHVGGDAAPEATEAPLGAEPFSFAETPAVSEDAFNQGLPEDPSEPANNDFMPAFQFPEAAPAAEEPSAEEASAYQEEPPAEYNPDIFLGGADPARGATEQSPDFGPADDPLGLNEYANSELSQGKDGLLVFRILISGIDTKEIRQDLREAMEDKRFNWNPAQLMASIKKGELRIDNVSPVKATVLINRIKRLPLQIRWEQYAITQVDNSEV